MKPFKYTYEKEIVMYAFFKKLDYFSTECIYAPYAARGAAREFVKDLEVRILAFSCTLTPQSARQISIASSLTRHSLRCFMQHIQDTMLPAGQQPEACTALPSHTVTAAVETYIQLPDGA